MNKIEIISDSDPYKLDITKKQKLVALTEKNAKFIEAILKLDSKYNKNNSPDENYDPEKHVSDAGRLYCGSQAYWFNKMQEPNADFRKCVLGAVISVDRSNSTHLEASKNGRKKMCNIICEECSNFKELEEKLKIKYLPEDNNHLINKMLVPFKSIKDGKSRFNLSFASKFCSIAAKNLGLTCEYSKYDNVVSDMLPQYVKLYLGEDLKKNFFKIPSDSKERDDEKRMNRAEYSDYIGKIIDNLKKDNIHISRKEFDHIIWYASK